MPARRPTLRSMAMTALLQPLVALPIAGTQAMAPVRLVPVLEIGCLDCEGPRAFGSVQALAVGRGRVVVADRDPPHLRAFDLEGGFLGAGGATGDGPGELRLPLAVSVTPDGLAVVDMRRMRLSLLDDGLSEVGGERMERFPMAAAFAPGGAALYVTLTDFCSGNTALSAWEPGGAWRVVEDTLAVVPFEDGLPPPVISLARAADGAFAVGMGVDRYHLVFYAADGRMTRQTVRDVPRTPKAADEIEAERASRAAAMARMGRAAPGPEGEALAKAAIVVDPLRPHFRAKALAWDGEGRLWVRTDRARSGTTFDLFDGEGRYLGEVTVPVRADTFALGDGHLASEVRGDLDVPTVRVWRVDPGRP